MRVYTQTKKLDGKGILSIGICVMICKVFIKLQIYFIDNPKNIERAKLVINPVIRDLSRRVNDLCKTFKISVKIKEILSKLNYQNFLPKVV